MRVPPSPTPLLQKRWHVSAGTAGVVVLGTTGEASALTLVERDRVLAVALDEVGGKLCVMCGTGSASTAATIEATLRAARAGADAALVVSRTHLKRPRNAQAGLSHKTDTEKGISSRTTQRCAWFSLAS